MITNFNIGDCLLWVDIEKTHQFYLTQVKIKDNCQCDDCKFYSEIFIKEPLEIFLILSSLGVDLQRNLTSEPTGIWCIKDEKNNFLHCNQVYQVVGNFLQCERSQLKYEKQENNYKVVAIFLNSNSKTIDIDLHIDKV